MKATLIVLFSIIGVLAIGFSLQMFGLVNYKFFAPKYENVRREVYENTQSYVEGKRQEVVKYKLEYELADDNIEKEAIRRMILQTTANLDLSLLPVDLENFVLSLR